MILFSPMTVLDSRRITGPSLVLDRPGAVLDVRLDEREREQAIAAWRRAVQGMLDALGWTSETLAVRSFAGGASVGFTAPIDALYAATDVNEWAWEAATAELQGESRRDPGPAADAIRKRIRAEENPRLLALRDAAAERGVTFLSDDDGVSVGSGTGVLLWPPDAVPVPSEVDWSTVHDIPVVLVTGSNGKTTVVRLLAAMLSAGDTTPGITSTDGVVIGSTLLEQGDFSGPSGARLVLRSPAVETAVLETARGGILRRGITVSHADVSVVTNIAEDHLGEFGVQTLDDLAETKLLVAKVLRPGGTLVLNADDPMLVERSRKITASITWFSLSPKSGLVAEHLSQGGTAVVLEEDQIVVFRRGERMPVVSLEEVPIAFGGRARHNVANAMTGVAAGLALGLAVPQMASVLRSFGRDAADNPGRANLTDIGGITILVDYAHNPDGMAALVRVAQAFPARRRLVMVGQAGDRDDQAIRDLARSAWALRPDKVVVNEMDQYLRGRALGEVSALLADEFSRLGAPDAAITRVNRELEGVEAALSWARAGDLLVLTVHQERTAVFQLLDRLKVGDWKPGDPLPEPDPLRV
jgi:cyanophycin synthetase